MHILSGYEDKTFKPGGNVTRSELAKMISVVFDLEETSIYSDVEGTLSLNDIPMIDTEYIPHIGKALEQ